MFEPYKIKEKPLPSFAGYGGGAAGIAQNSAAGAATDSDEYLYLPFNENSTSRDMFGDYADSITMNSGGSNTSTHPYTVTDSTYNNGDEYSLYVNGDDDTPYLSANTKLGAVGTGDLCMDMYYYWITAGGDANSYGYIGDYKSGHDLYPSHTGLDEDNYLALGAINTTVRGRFRENGNSTINYNASLTTSSELTTWFHVLVLRQSNKWYSFVDGVLDGYYAESSALDIDNGGGFHFGTIDRANHWWSCYITDFMWQKGSDAFYTIDSGVGSGDIGTTYFAKPQYKNKLMAIPSNSDFSIVKAPSGFTTE